MDRELAAWLIGGVAVGYLVLATWALTAETRLQRRADLLKPHTYGLPKEPIMNTVNAGSALLLRLPDGTLLAGHIDPASLDFITDTDPDSFTD